MLNTLKVLNVLSLKLEARISSLFFLMLQENEIENPDICNSQEDYVPDQKECNKVKFYILNVYLIFRWY